mgnify:CR=1 FL=1
MLSKRLILHNGVLGFFVYLIPTLVSIAMSRTCPLQVTEAVACNDSWVQLQALQVQLVQQQAASQKQNVTSALQIRLQAARQKTRPGTQRSPFERMQLCRNALERLDAQGWSRSHHQRLFHEDFLVSLCVLVTWCTGCKSLCVCDSVISHAVEV